MTSSAATQPNVYSFPFDEDESRSAYEQWGANCGPNALAFATCRKLSDVRRHMKDFDKKRYTNPCMMKEALNSMRVAVLSTRQCAFPGGLPDQGICLVRIQFLGPWMKPEVNPKWRYRQTHWIAAWKVGASICVFDVNCGIIRYDQWETGVLPVLVEAIPRATLGYETTHVWHIGRISQ